MFGLNPSETKSEIHRRREETRIIVETQIMVATHLRHPVLHFMVYLAAPSVVSAENAHRQQCARRYQLLRVESIPVFLYLRRNPRHRAVGKYGVAGYNVSRRRATDSRQTKARENRPIYKSVY